MIGSIFIKMIMENTKIKINKNKNEKGQTLLFVIVAVTIATAVGVSVSTRTIQSLKRVARTDTSARVIATAEGGIENLLSRNYSQLDKAVYDGVNPPDCTAIEAETGPEAGTCAYVFNKDGAEDLISSRAIITVGTFSSNEGNGYSFTTEPGSIKEVNLDGYRSGTIKICWVSNQAAIYYSSYNSSGGVKKGGIQPAGFANRLYLSNKFSVENESNSNPSYSLCDTVQLVSNPYGLRIKVLYNSSKVAVFPTSGSLPTQGYKFTSRGEIVTGSGGEEKATVIVHRSYPYAPDIFDYGIYTPTTLSGSN